MDKIKQIVVKYKIELIIIVASIIIDQFTKLLVLNAFESEGDSKVIIDGFFELTYHKNIGAAWSILSGKMAFLIIITFFALGFFIYLLQETEFSKTPFYCVTLAMVIGGTLGNFIDRVFRKGVVDFLDFIIFGYDFPIFNVADMCLVLGTIGIFIHILFLENRGKKNES